MKRSERPTASILHVPSQFCFLGMVVLQKLQYSLQQASAHFLSAADRVHMSVPYGSQSVQSSQSAVKGHRVTRLQSLHFIICGAPTTLAMMGGYSDVMAAVVNWLQ